MSLNYAQGTSVEASRTQGEISGLLARIGCDRIINAQEPGQCVIYFEIEQRGFKFSLPLPRPDETRFTHQKVLMELPHVQVGSIAIGEAIDTYEYALKEHRPGPKDAHRG